MSDSEARARGRLRGRAALPGLLDALQPEVRRLAVRPRSFAERIELAELGPVWFKGGPLSGRARLRHAVWQKLLRRGLPRTREFANLAWLRKHLFQAPEPLVAGWLETCGSASFQFLITAEVARARPLEEAWSELSPASRSELASELGRELARLHALGFVHRDLYVRNLLVADPVAGRRLVFLDAWRSGRPLPGRGPAYDLACLTLQGEQLFEREELATFFRAYQAEGHAQGAPRASTEAAALEGRLLASRARLVRQIERDPARGRGRTPSRDWKPPLER